MIHEFAQGLGKENFYLIGEITGGRSYAYTKLEVTGLDAALGVDDIPDKLEFLVKGWRDPQEYFDLFRNSLLVRKGSHVWFRNKVVTVLDDHDQVRKGGSKARFCADRPPASLAVAALALNATTLGIPCIYYGSEQMFDGEGSGDSADRYIREACSEALSAPSVRGSGTSSGTTGSSTGNSPRCWRCADAASRFGAGGSICARFRATAMVTVCRTGSAERSAP